MSQKFISVLADASDGDIPAGLIFSIVGLNMPAMGLLMLPLSLYIGILITFGRLYAESEIVVMNATGIGNKFLVQAALYLALITSGVAAFNALWLSPWSQDRVEHLYEQVAAENSVDLLKRVSSKVRQTVHPWYSLTILRTARLVTCLSRKCVHEIRFYLA